MRLPVEQRWHRPLKQIKRAIEQRIVPAIFDDTAGMGNGGAITLEQASRFSQRKPASDMRQIHRHLPRQRNIGTPARGPAQVCFRYAKHLHHCMFNGIATQIRR